MKVISATRRAH